MIEFEVKARVPVDALARVRDRLGEPERTERHEDRYFGHPVRDFGVTDEALRLRVVDDRAELTFKGPKLDAASKARREVTTRVADPGALAEILDAVDFRSVATVRKVREVYHHERFEVALDRVDGLDGAFVELERQVASADEFPAAREDAARVLAAWGVTLTERRSYLELLFEKDEKK